jgi:putative transposase
MEATVPFVRISIHRATILFMPRNARCVAPDLPYHITQRGTDCQTTFHSRQDRQVYVDLLRTNLPECGVRMLGYCLMTNHVHLVAIP